MIRDFVCSLAAPDDEREEALRFLSAQGYAASVGSGDRVFAAIGEGRVIGAVRLADESDVLVLRGMRVSLDAQRCGVGTALLRTLASHIGPRACYCIPYRWLEAFYGTVGFAALDPAAAPDFLVARLSGYRAAGKDVIIMRRP